MQTKEELLQHKEIDGEMLKAAYDKAAELITIATDEFTEKFPSSASIHNFYRPGRNYEWTPGFWTGEVWLAYEKTGDEALKQTAEIEVKDFFRRIKKREGVNHHDMGFLYCPSCVAAYKLTGSETGKEAAIMAADNLMARFQEKGQFFQAWGRLGNKNNYRLIIDCLLNMPLLFWAGELTGDKEYEKKAEAHIKTSMKNIIRDDNSTYHTFFFDVKTGVPEKGVTHQGNRDGSAWARGQAWGVYGIALSYRYLKTPEYLDLFCQVTDYFIAHLPEDLVPYWDFDFDTGSTEPRDSSASAIAICGILEMSSYLDKEKAEKYLTAADKMLCALMDHCANTDKTRSNGLLLHGTYARDSAYNTCINRGVDECSTWGDYFYMEALTRRMKDWKPYW